jgi:AAA15 family ATPase/GTPase
MLIRFKVENFFSFKEATEFNMIPGEINNLQDHIHIYENLNVLKSAVIYGANATGKSSLVHSLDFLTRFIIEGSLFRYNLEGRHFQLDDNTNPSILEIEFLHGTDRYTYHISFRGNIIVDEWMLKILPDSKDELLFLRTVALNQQAELVFGFSCTQSQNSIAIQPSQLPEPEVPFICTPIGRKFNEINDAYQWITHELRTLPLHMRFTSITHCYMEHPNFPLFLKNWVRKFNIGILDFELVTTALEDHESYIWYSKKERKELLKKIRVGHIEPLKGTDNALAMIEDGLPIVKELLSCRRNSSGHNMLFDFTFESVGTLRLINLILTLYYVKYYKLTVILDDITFGVHPVLFKELIMAFEKDHDTLGQLIWTTYDPLWLDQEVFGKDQLWVVQKDEWGATRLDRFLS